jgi:hypothetical protein
VCHVAREEFRQPKIHYLGAHVLIMENVARLDVTVDDLWPDFLVNVSEPFGDADADLHRCPPVNSDTTGNLPEEAP